MLLRYKKQIHDVWLVDKIYDVWLVENCLCNIGLRPVVKPAVVVY